MTADVPAYGLVVGAPARLRAWVCVCGRPLAAPEAPLPARCAALRARSRVGRRAVIEISSPHIGALEESLVREVLRSGRLVKGPMGERFEEAVRVVVGTKHAVAVNSGTSALIASLLAHGIGAGDEVLTSPFTFVATLNAILHVGATSPLRRHRRRTSTSMPVRSRIRSDPRRAPSLPCICTAGPPICRSIVPACTERDVVVVEDAAQALGATIEGRARRIVRHRLLLVLRDEEHHDGRGRGRDDRR